ncbi:hypothetical protein GCM10009759_55540 [Kitasatospora saccharophila]|uniref:Uncharacterized protein n=1 Tax=Kitasatospora saccharophila TaxID=407973 RepID=A0ABN2XI02_9ACTN
MKHQPLLAARAAKLIQGAGIRRLRSRRAAAALADAGLLAWPAEADPSGLSLGLEIRAVGMGVELDAYRLFRVLVGALAAESVEDPEGVAAELAVIDGAKGPEWEAVLDVLIERLGGAEVRYPTARSVHRLIERLAQAAGPVLPAQQDRRAS